MKRRKRHEEALKHDTEGEIEISTKRTEKDAEKSIENKGKAIRICYKEGWRSKKIRAEIGESE